MVQALQQARDVLDQGECEYALIVGLESLLNNAAIDFFLAGGRAPYCRLLTEENSDGFIPGEAAAAVLLSRPNRSRPAPIHCSGLGLGLEPSPFDSDEPSRADGMVQAVEAAVAEAGLRVSDTDFRINNVSGEAYFFEEDALMLYRACDPPRQTHPLWQFADSIGEVSAAGGAVMICMMYWGALKGYLPGPNVLCCLSSERGVRLF